MYLFYKKSAHVDKTFVENGGGLLLNHKALNDLAHYVKKNIQNELLDNARCKMLQSDDKQTGFTHGIFGELDKTVRIRVLEYCLHEKLIDLVIDGGFGNNEASTIIDCTSNEAEIIREGIGTLDIL